MQTGASSPRLILPFADNYLIAIGLRSFVMNPPAFNVFLMAWPVNKKASRISRNAFKNM